MLQKSAEGSRRIIKHLSSISYNIGSYPWVRDHHSHTSSIQIWRILVGEIPFSNDQYADLQLRTSTSDLRFEMETSLAVSADTLLADARSSIEACVWIRKLPL